MRFVLWISVWLRRVVILIVLAIVALGLPVAYVEFACKGKYRDEGYNSLLPGETKLNEGRTYATYPELHILNAYSDYAQVVSQSDPHAYNFFGSVKNFWSSTCTLRRKADQHGGFPSDIKARTYINGVGFTAHMVLKGMYEETIGRILTLVRGNSRAPLDDLSARQAQGFAQSLRQTPWHQWNYSANAKALWEANSRTPRDWERAIALNIENRFNSFSAGIASAFSGEIAAEKPLHMTVKDLSPAAIASIPSVTVVGTSAEGTEIQVPRGRALDIAMSQIVGGNGSFGEIAGNDDIMLTVIAPKTERVNSFLKFDIEGSDNIRHLVEVKVWGLADRLREYSQQDIVVEKIHYY